MATRRYHLVCQGFRDDRVNKTELSLMLKSRMHLSDAQVADLMAARRFILARNLPAEKAQELGKKLLKVGLNIKAESADANQKVSADELRQHLLDGGLSHYFAGRYRHPIDELETRVSLLLLASIPLFVFVVFPLIGLSLLRPLLSLSIWSGQFVAAVSQLLFVLLCFLPAVVFWPAKPAQRSSGIELDEENELLLYAIAEEVSQYLSGPRIKALVLVEGPVLRLRQSPWQWLRREAELEVGLAHLQSMNLQQFVGSLLYQVTPNAPAFYYWSWPLYLLWSNSLKRRFPASFDRLLQWLQPMHDHQSQRQSSSVQALIGPREAMRLNALYKQLEHIQQHWDAFGLFCKTQQRVPTDWADWLQIPTSEADVSEQVEGQFRMNAPAEWALSNAAGYAKALTRQHEDTEPLESASTLWEAFRNEKPSA